MGQRHTHESRGWRPSGSFISQYLAEVKKAFSGAKNEKNQGDLYKKKKMWFHPRDPRDVWAEASNSKTKPQVQQAFFISAVCWDPFLRWDRLDRTCFRCGKGRLESKGLSEWRLGIGSTSRFAAMCRNYRCSERDCFRGGSWDPALMKSFPAHVRDAFGMVVLEKTLVHRSVLDYMTHQPSRNDSFNSELLEAMHKLHFDRLKLSFESYVLEAFPDGGAPDDFPSMGEFDDPFGYGGAVLDRRQCATLWDFFHDQHRQQWDHEMEILPAPTISCDHAMKPTAMTTPSFGGRTFNSVFKADTVGIIRSWSLQLGKGSVKESEERLRRVAESCKFYGHDQTSLATSDRSEFDRAMLERSFPAVRRHSVESSGADSLPPLPPGFSYLDPADYAWAGGAPKIINSFDAFVSLLESYVRSSLHRQATDPLLISLDLEWDKTCKSMGHVLIIGADVASHGDSHEVGCYIVQLPRCFRSSRLGTDDAGRWKVPAIVTQFFESTSIIKHGKNISPDMDRIGRTIAVDHMRGIVDVAHVCKARLVRGPDGLVLNAKTGLDDLLAACVQKRIPGKNGSDRVSNLWSSDDLSHSQCGYALLDWIASILVLRHALSLRDPARRLSEKGASPYLNSGEVDVLPASSGLLPVARGKLLEIRHLRQGNALSASSKAEKKWAVVEVTKVLNPSAKSTTESLARSVQPDAPKKRMPRPPTRSLGSMGPVPFRVLVELQRLRDYDPEDGRFYFGDLFRCQF